jgi:hypothetical protein
MNRSNYIKQNFQTSLVSCSFLLINRYYKSLPTHINCAFSVTFLTSPITTCFRRLQFVFAGFILFSRITTRFRRFQLVFADYNMFSPISTCFRRFQFDFANYNLFSRISTGFRRLQFVFTDYNLFSRISIVFILKPVCFGRVSICTSFISFRTTYKSLDLLHITACITRKFAFLGPVHCHSPCE